MSAARPQPSPTSNISEFVKNISLYDKTWLVSSSIIELIAPDDVLFGLLLDSVFVPATVFAIPLYLLLSRSGLATSLLAVILPSLVNPFGIYLICIYTEQVAPRICQTRGE